MNKHLSLYAILLGTLATPSIVVAELLDLPQLPLISASGVDPNVMLVLDDSGSMDWEITSQPHYSACNYFNPSNYSGCTNTLVGTGNFSYAQTDVSNKRFNNKTLYYIYNLRNKYSSDKSVQYPNLINEDWRVFDSNFNTTFYNPDIEFKPWDGPCSSSIAAGSLTMCANANFTSVKAHPKEGNPDYNYNQNLDNTTYNSIKHIPSYIVSIDDKGYSGVRPALNNMTVGANGQVDLWDSYAEFQIPTATTMTVKIYQTNSSPAVKSLVQQTTLSTTSCFDALGPRTLVNGIIQGTRSITATDAPGCKTIAQVRQNYANWFEFSRRRAFTARGAISYVVNKYPSFNYGMHLINSSTITVPFPALNANKLNHNMSLVNTYLADTIKSQGTPLVTALDLVGKYYKGDLGPSPIYYACQMNAAIMLTDGYYSNSNLPQRGDVDGDGFGSNGSTLADIARYYYVTDLSTLANKVPVSAWDNNPKQHMNFYGMSFGAKGKLIEGADGWPTPALTYNSNWGNPLGCSDCSEKIDDLWHAAFNARGAFGSIGNVSEMIGILEKAISQIGLLNKASLSSVAVKSSSLQSDKQIFQATFDSGSWSGDLSAYPISQAGVINTAIPDFEASKLLNSKAFASRLIITHNGTQGVAFNSTNLSSSQLNYATLLRNKLVAKFGETLTPSIAQLTDYIRGDRSKESDQGGILRTRKNVLGDIIHSSPIYIPAPTLGYSDPTYITFKNAQANRTPMLAVGANDGMLHLFSGTTGQELLGYIPGNKGLWGQLYSLADPDYQHKSYVDGSISYNDVELNGGWKTILVGALRTGGKGIFALDITDGNFTSDAAKIKQTVAFEFTGLNDPDMGYVFGEPQIVKMNNNKWAIVIGNGYNATQTTYPSGEAVASPSTSKKAHLFILFIEKGLSGNWVIDQDYIKIPVGTNNSNGLSQPFPVDFNNDYKVDYIYAGDLDGNVWKFDVTSTDPLEWKKTTNQSALFTTPTTALGKQPITSSVVVGPHPDGLSKGMMVYFGTGKYIETKDNLTVNQPTQAFYGIWDKNVKGQATITATGSLLQQSILAENASMRAVSNNTISWVTHLGWVLNLEVAGVNQGEKVIGTPRLRNSRIIFTTVIPNGNLTQDPCDPNLGVSWVMELDAKDGSRLDMTPYDMNGDGKFTEADYMTFINPVTGATETAPVGGIKSEAGILAGTPAILSTDSASTEIKVMSGSNGLKTKTESVDKQNVGRQSWQQVN